MMHQPQPKQCFTIGYGNYPIDRFVGILQNVGIDTIIDVRSFPYSRFNPHFNRENLTLRWIKWVNQIGFFRIHSNRLAQARPDEASRRPPSRGWDPSYGRGSGAAAPVILSEGN